MEIMFFQCKVLHIKSGNTGHRMGRSTFLASQRCHPKKEGLHVSSRHGYKEPGEEWCLRAVTLDLYC